MSVTRARHSFETCLSEPVCALYIFAQNMEERNGRYRMHGTTWITEQTAVRAVRETLVFESLMILDYVIFPFSVRATYNNTLGTSRHDRC